MQRSLSEQEDNLITDKETVALTKKTNQKPKYNKETWVIVHSDVISTVSVYI